MQVLNVAVFHFRRGGCIFIGMSKVDTIPRNVGGRGKKALLPDEATLKIVRGAAMIQTTVRELAMFLGVGLATCEEFLKVPAVAEIWEAGQAEGKMSLRRSQYRLAEKNAAMAIHLGKVYLGQKEEVHLKHDFSDLTDEQLRERMSDLAQRALKAADAGHSGSD